VVFQLLNLIFNLQVPQQFQRFIISSENLEVNFNYETLSSQRILNFDFLLLMINFCYLCIF
jgi:hypothetical protein